MPCRCDGYETNSCNDESEDLHTRLCRCQSVVKDLASLLQTSRIELGAALARRAKIEIKELEAHKAEEAELEAAERRVEAARAELTKAEQAQSIAHARKKK